MKIKMLSSLSGLDFSLSPDETTTRFRKKEAQRLIDAGLAEAVVAAPPKPASRPKNKPVEKAVTEPAPETRD